MLGYKQIILYTLCFCTVKHIDATKSLPNINIEWEPGYSSRGRAQAIVQSRDTLYRVVNYEKQRGEYFLRIHSIYPAELNATCEFPSTPDRFTKVVSLGNADIVIWTNPSSTNVFNIIDTAGCINKTVYYENGLRDVAILPYYDTFDVVYDGCPSNGDQECVHRYNEEGSLIEKFDRILMYSYFVSRRFGVLKNNRAYNFFVIRKLNIRKTAIDIYRHSNEYNNSYSFLHPIESYSTAHNNFSLCYMNPDHDGPYDEILKCMFLDGDFNVKVNVTEIKHDKYIRSIQMHNLQDGGAIVVYSIPKYVGSSHVYYRHIDARGNPGDEDILVEEFNSEKTNIYIYEQSAAEKNYCIILSSFSTVSGKCVTV